jgi:hypothetical protein
MSIKNKHLNQVLLELDTINDSSKIKDKLIESDPSGDRSNIEASILSGDKEIYNTLWNVIIGLTPEDWFSIISTKQQNLNLLDKWYQTGLSNNFLDVDALELMLINITPEHKFQLLTQPLVEKAATESKDSLLTISLESHFDKIFFLQDLSFDKLFDALLAFPGSDKNHNFLYINPFEDVNSLINLLIKDKAIKTKLTNMLIDYHKAKKATHFLGIKDIGTDFNVATNKSTAVKTNQPVASFEGMFDATSLNYFQQVINAFVPSQKFNDIFEKIKQSFNQAKVNEIYLEEDYKRYQEHQLIIIPSGWPGHSIIIAATNNFLVVANRGEGVYKEDSEMRGCVIYPLQKPLELTDIEVFARKERKEIVENKINELVKKNHQNEPEVLQALPIQAQKYGTCTIANKKAVVAGLLFLDEYLKLNQQDNDFLVKQKILEDTRAEYKKFTEHTRKYILDEMLEELNSSKADNNTMLIQGLANFFNQHLDLTKSTEKALLNSIITKMPDSITQVFLDKLTSSGRLVYHLLPNLNDNDTQLVIDAINFLPRIDNLKQEEFFTFVTKILEDNAIAKSKENLDNAVKSNFEKKLIDKPISLEDWLKDEHFEFIIATKNYALCIEAVGEKKFLEKFKDKVVETKGEFFSEYFFDPQDFEFILNRFSSENIVSLVDFDDDKVRNLFYVLLSQPIDTQKIEEHLKNLQQLSEMIQDHDKVIDYLLVNTDPTGTSGLVESFGHNDLASFTLGFLHSTQLMQVFSAEFPTQEWLNYQQDIREDNLDLDTVFEGIKFESIFDKAIGSNAALVVFEHLQKTLTADQLQQLVIKNIEANLNLSTVRNNQALLKKYLDSAKNHLPEQPYFEKLLKTMAKSGKSHCLSIIRPYLGDKVHQLICTHYTDILNLKINSRRGLYLNSFFSSGLEKKDIDSILKKLVNNQQDWAKRLSKIIETDNTLNRYVALLSAFPAKYRNHFLPLPLLGTLLGKYPKPHNRLLKQLVGSSQLTQCAQLINNYSNLPSALQDPLRQFLQNPDAQHLIELLRADNSSATPQLQDWLTYSFLQLTKDEQKIFYGEAVFQLLEQKSYRKVLSEIDSAAKKSNDQVACEKNSCNKTVLFATSKGKSKDKLQTEVNSKENKKKPKPN